MPDGQRTTTHNVMLQLEKDGVNYELLVAAFTVEGTEGEHAIIDLANRDEKFLVIEGKLERNEATRFQMYAPPGTIADFTKADEIFNINRRDKIPG